MYFSKQKTAVITGANSGIGKASALGLARLGVNLILIARNHVRGERAVWELKKETQNQNIHLLICDLSSIESIQKVSAEIHDRFDKIDILINNAGARFGKRHITIDGVEATFAVNYLSRFLLTNLLLDLIKKSANGRIINVSGEAHRRGRIYFNDLTLKKFYHPVKAVMQAKLADVVFTYELAGRLNKTAVTVNCLHPGAVSTNILYNDPDTSGSLKFLYKIISPFFRSPEKGAETVLYLAVSPEVNNVSGKYFIDKKCVKTSAESYNKELANKLWKQSEKLILLKNNNLKKIMNQTAG